MTRMRDHLVLFWVTVILATVALNLVGFWSWDRWLQLAVMAVLMVVCTRLLAPVYYGWREPEDYPGRRTRP